MIWSMASPRDPLGWAGAAVGRHPLLVVAALLLITIALGTFGSQREVSGALELFATDTPLSRDMELVEQRFGRASTESRVQIVFDAGEADVLDVEPIGAATRVTEALLAAPEVGPRLAKVDRPVVSFATPVIEGLRGAGFDPGSAPSTVIDEAAQRSLTTEEGSTAVSLYSTDLDLGQARARAGLMLVNLDPDLDPATAAQVAGAVREVLDATDTDGVRVLPFNGSILQQESAASTRRELPFLLGLGVAVIAVILAFNYRTLSDVLIGLAGLVMAVTWMFGVAVLLGPRYAGLVGPFTAVSNVSPVVFLGLGIDDAIQLTARYREDQGVGLAPRTAARTALVGVGGAIVLTSATTMLGFLTNFSSPIPPIQDFGLFTAVGQLAATTIMLLLVPSVRNLLDTRRAGRRRNVAGPPLALSALVERSMAYSLRAPVVTIVLALAVTVAGFVASTRIPSQFDRRDFLPQGSVVRDGITALEELFDGDRNEQTYVLLEGALATPAAANALLDVEGALAGDPDIRPREDGVPDIRSVAGLVADVAADPAVAGDFRQLGWAGGRFAADADVAGLYALAREREPARAAEVVADGDGLGVLRLATTAGQEGAERLRDELLVTAGPLRDAGLDTRVVSQRLVNTETNAALTRSGTNSIATALAVAIVLLTVYFGVRVRRPFLGVLTMMAAVFVVGLVFGTMLLLDIPYNGLTVTIAAIAVGVGVTFSIHMTYRTIQEVDGGAGIDEAVQTAVRSTGAAIASSGAATVAGFGALTVSDLLPLRQFGIVSSVSILYAIIAAVLVLPAFLVVWGRRRLGTAPAPDDEPARFQVGLEWAAVIEPLTVPPAGLQQADMGDGRVRLLLVDGQPVQADVVDGNRGPAPAPDLVLPLDHLPEGAVVEHVEIQGDVLVFSGRIAAH